MTTQNFNQNSVPILIKLQTVLQQGFRYLNIFLSILLTQLIERCIRANIHLMNLQIGGEMVARDGTFS